MKTLIITKVTDGWTAMQLKSNIIIHSIHKDRYAAVMSYRRFFGKESKRIWIKTK